MTDQQKRATENLLREICPTEVHHGDCMGADFEFHGIAYEVCGETLRRVIHPSVDDAYRAFCDGDEARPAKPYVERDHDIVDETEVLIAMPITTGEIMRSGTWATVRYARKVGRPIFIVSPRGRVEVENLPTAKAAQ